LLALICQPNAAQLELWKRPAVLKKLVEEQPSQTTDSIMMVAPTYFFSNDEAKLDNFYMSGDVKLTKQRTRELALAEYSQLYYRLRNAGVHINLFAHQPYHNTPDACFPNNWITTHTAHETGGKKAICLWPMKVSNRRLERRPRIVQALNMMSEYNVLSMSDYEMFGEYLEGTGALCFDRINKIVYVAKSERAHIVCCRVTCVGQSSRLLTAVAFVACCISVC
jgi:hypothetical protein